MKRKITLLMIAWALAMTFQLTAQAKSTYVGGGRYTCEGDTARCAQVRQGNAAQERQKRVERAEREEKADRYARKLKEHQERLNRPTGAEPRR